MELYRKPAFLKQLAALNSLVYNFCLSESFERKISNINPSLAFELLNVLGAVVSGSQVRGTQ